MEPSWYYTQKSGYGSGLKILKITVIWLFLNWFIIRIYHFEVDIMMHLYFCDPAVKFFLDQPKKIELLRSIFPWPRSKILSRSSKNIALKYWTWQFGGCGWVGFSRSPPQIFPFLLALRGYFQNFHTSSQTHITLFYEL